MEPITLLVLAWLVADWIDQQTADTDQGQPSKEYAQFRSQAARLPVAQAPRPAIVGTRDDARLAQGVVDQLARYLQPLAVDRETLIAAQRLLARVDPAGYHANAYHLDFRHCKGIMIGGGLQIINGDGARPPIGLADLRSAEGRPFDPEMASPELAPQRTTEQHHHSHIPASSAGFSVGDYVQELRAQIEALRDTAGAVGRTEEEMTAAEQALVHAFDGGSAQLGEDSLASVREAIEHGDQARALLNLAAEQIEEYLRGAGLV